MPQSRPVRLLLATGTMLLALAWVWRFQVLNGFTLTFGDRYDAQIEVALLQHWANVLAGAEAWNRVAWFHPAPDTLGYNDGYLASGLVYAAGRSLGLSPFAAADLAHAMLKAIGFAGMALLLRRAGRVRFGFALFGATLFTIADLTIAHANHGQLFALGFAPWAALAAWETARGIAGGERRRVLAGGIALGSVFALWLATGYYLAWFFALYLLVLGTLLLTGGGARTLKAAIGPLAVAALVGLVLLVPFLLVYLPKVRETGMHDPAIALHTTLWPIDLVNTGPMNLVWGWLPGAIRASVAPGLTAAPDATFGMPPLFVAATIVAIFRAQRMPERRWLGPVAVALLACWLLMLNLGGVMPWRLVQWLVPGAGGIRVVGRFAILLLLPAVFLLTVALDRMRRFALPIAAALLIEQVATGAPVRLDTVERMRALAAVPAPPLACRSFAVVAATPPARGDPAIDRIYAGNVDAMLLASLWARPTINGVSTFAPPGWDFAETTEPDFPFRVRRYARRFGLSHVCLLDMRRSPPWSMLE